MCLYPCEDTTNYYNIETKECVQKCGEGYDIIEEEMYKICKLQGPLTDSAKLQVESTAAVSTASGEVAAGGLGAASAINPADSGGFSLLVLGDMIHQIRYLKINYPPKVEYYFLQDKSSLSLNFGPDIPDGLKESFPNKTLVENFAKYDLHSSFLVNFWKNITTMILIIVIGLFFKGLEYIFKRKSIHDYGFLFERLRVITLWNFFLLIFCSNYAKIVLFTSLEF
mmetsp:Transcript_5609/g.4752  ORF Transcript_5609/g.4752 Transcript_5609/m.4752 type:complete len:225 (+) Transcript_5609:230-904(+)